MDKKEFYYKQFLNFLKENDCFDKFKNNWYALPRYAPRSRGFGKYFYNLKEFLLPPCLIPMYMPYKYVKHDSFPWTKTLEGSYFWNEIEDKWFKYSAILFDKDNEFFDY